LQADKPVIAAKMAMPLESLTRRRKKGAPGAALGDFPAMTNQTLFPWNAKLSCEG
jgi:hypothetical protein